MLVCSLLILLASGRAFGCTSVLITPGATIDSSSFITYNADSDGHYGNLHFNKRATWPAGSMVDIYEWDSGKYIGQISQVSETYNVVGNMNEHQVAIGESTFGGLTDLAHQSKGLIDYGSLIYLALQRSRTAREAISVMTTLVKQYGYYSTGESFSISDPKEVWYMEMIGKGEYELGAVWVAMRVPDGYVSAHANHPRITVFPRSDPENCLFSPDVVSFAKAHGFYPASAADALFSFSDVYSPITFQKARTCEARVWSVFRRVSSAQAMDPFLSYVTGRNLTNRMPLWVKAAKRLSVNDTMMLMRDHYEDTPLDFTTDVGATSYAAPVRFHPLTWNSNGKTYMHERPISTQQTGFGIVAQSRSWIPSQFGGLLWFAVDDTACSVYFPAYTNVTRVSSAYVGGGITDADFGRAFWAFSLVANWAYPRWSQAYPVVFARINAMEAKYFTETAQIEATAAQLLKQSVANAVEYLTSYSETTGDALVAEWFQFFRFLFARLHDGNVMDIVDGKAVISKPGYTASWYSRIVAEAGDRYLIPDAAMHDGRTDDTFLNR